MSVRFIAAPRFLRPTARLCGSQSRLPTNTEHKIGQVVKETVGEKSSKTTSSSTCSTTTHQPVRRKYTDTPESCQGYASYFLADALRAHDVVKFQSELPEINETCLEIGASCRGQPRRCKELVEEVRAFTAKLTADAAEQAKLNAYANRIMQVGAYYRRLNEPTTPC